MWAVRSSASGLFLSYMLPATFICVLGFVWAGEMQLQCRRGITEVTVQREGYQRWEPPVWILPQKSMCIEFFLDSVRFPQFLSFFPL